jgi:hypothetical protein
MIGLARSFSITSQSSTEPTTQRRTAMPRPSASEPVWTSPSTVAQAPMAISPSSPRCQMPARWASTPAMVT